MFKIRNNTKSIYLDNAAATPLCAEAGDIMREADKSYANPSSIHKLGTDSKSVIEIARKHIAKVINTRKNEIYFTSSGTESINLALMGLTYSWHEVNEKKNENKSRIVPKIITTRIEHSATLETLKYLESRNLIEVLYLDINEFGMINLEYLRNVLSESGGANVNNIICISIVYANNEIGVVQPAKEIGRVINLYNLSLDDNANPVYYHLDACQAINYLNIDVYNLRCHLMSFNSSKIYGPKGVAALYVSPGVKLLPVMYGGEQERGLRSGTLNTSSIAGFGEAVIVTNDLKSKEVKRLLHLQNKTISKIKEEIKEAIIYNPINSQDVILAKGEIDYSEIRSLPNIINIGLPGMRSDEMVIRLSEIGIYVSHKSSCGSQDDNGSYVLMSLGRSQNESNENIRISMGRSTSESEMEHCIHSIKNIYYKFRAIS